MFRLGELQRKVLIYRPKKLPELGNGEKFLRGDREGSDVEGERVLKQVSKRVEAQTKKARMGMEIRGWTYLTCHKLRCTSKAQKSI